MPYRLELLCFATVLLTAPSWAQQINQASYDPLFAYAAPISNAMSSGVDYSRPAAVQSIAPVKTMIEVNAKEQTLHEGVAVPYHIPREEIFSSAGTYGDFTRYVQVLPGVVWNSDKSNEVMVRGGHPSENLYVVDGIEVPNINHMAVEGTTGGFTSMIDTATVESVEMKTDAYDTRYSSRLSSLVEIRTREAEEGKRAGELDMGIAGAGGFVEHPAGKNGSLLLSAHRSILDLVTNDIGMNGVPIYTNGLAKLQWTLGKNDHISALSLNGDDSINITPCAGDPLETLLTQTQYGGFRSTDGLIWQHIYKPNLLSAITASYSAQNQDIAQQQQNSGSAELSWGVGNGCKPVSETNVYDEKTHDGITTFGYNLQLDQHKWFFSLGVTGRLMRLNYRVAQPVGQQSPYQTDATWSDADNFQRNFSTGQTGSYFETTRRFGSRWTATGGLREETFALTGSQAFEPRASLAFQISNHQTINAAYARLAQLPPTINILSYAQNAALRPIRVEQISAGADLWRMQEATLSIAAYRKRYSDEPVSTEYSTLMFANMATMVGEQFVWLPMKSTGHGDANGIEMMLRVNWRQHLQLMGSTSYSRILYTAADGVRRPGNFDLPLVANGMATIMLTSRFRLSLRNTYQTGRPYTPFSVTASEEQDRGIYDLTQVNALRGSAYNRLDADVGYSFHIRHKLLNVYGGLENAFDRSNFLGYAWLDRCEASNGFCGVGVPEERISQMPRFPSFGARYSF